MKSFSVFLVFVFIATIPLAADPISVQCMDNAVYSQVFNNHDGGLQADTNSDYREVADDYTASAPFNMIRLFGANFTAPIGATQTFIIKIYDGPPLSGGILLHTFTKSGTPVNTGYISGVSQIYYIDIEFGTVVNQLSGWVGITRVHPADGSNFYANLKEVGGNAQLYYAGSPTPGWIQTNTHLFFCLGKSSPKVPVKNWSVFFGFVLIAGFLVWVTRRFV